MYCVSCKSTFFVQARATNAISPLSLHDALPIYRAGALPASAGRRCSNHRDGLASRRCGASQESSRHVCVRRSARSEEHTSELQSRLHLVCRLLLEKKNSPASIPKITHEEKGSLL